MEILESMLNSYIQAGYLKQRKIMKSFFTQYPAIGLLNVAVRLMGAPSLCPSLKLAFLKARMINLDAVTRATIILQIVLSLPPSLCLSQLFTVLKICNASWDHCSLCVCAWNGRFFGGAETPERTKGLLISLIKNFSHLTLVCAGVTVDDVIRRTTEYFESNIGVSKPGSLQVEKSFSLKKLHECEIWVTSQFSEQQFSVLGLGTFLEFLERHGHQFPPNLSSFLNGERSSASSLEVSVVQQQIRFLLCQAESNWLDNGKISVDSFVMLLKRQFPTISVDIVQKKLGLIGTTEAQRKNIQTNTIKFSIALLEKQWSGIFPGNADVLTNDIAQQPYPGSVSSQEAINCLLKAPLLSDLLLWSNWDLLFAPSLGSFTHWLLNTGPIQELSCILTTDGRFVRIDPSSTVDHFLEAVIQQSPFQVAVKLLSLLHIYNGSSNAPISLLKCYAQRAIDAIMNSNSDLINTGSEGKIFLHETPHRQSAEPLDCSSHYIGRIQGSSEIPSVRRIRTNSLSNIYYALELIAKFILDCLGRLPSEFWSLAADILLSGLRTVTKNCYSAILRACTQTWQLCMLHNIGLSLGVAEWVEDYRTTCRTKDVHASAEINSFSRHSSAVPEGHSHENASILTAADVDMMNERSKSFHGLQAINTENQKMLDPVGIKADMTELLATNRPPLMEEINLEEAALIIATIRREEFGLDLTLSYTDNSLLKKQHA